MRVLRYLIGTLSCLCLIVMLLVASIELGCFIDREFYMQEYDQLKVADTLLISRDDLARVTDVMLDYLEDKRDDLNVVVTMNGTQREFFNERELSHMDDVKALNLNTRSLGFLLIFPVCLGFAIIAIISARTGKSPLKTTLKTIGISLIMSTIVFAVLVGAGAYIVSGDFDTYWRMFHRLVFDNELWLLDPSTDMLINLVPLEFFIDLVIRCALIFGIVLGLLMIIAIALIAGGRNKKAVAAIVLALALAGNAFPQTTYADDALVTSPEIDSDAAIVIERNTGTVLYAKNPTKSEYPASTTKVMTALLALENLKLSDEITFSKTAVLSLPSGASHIGMKVGEVLSVEQCMYGLLLPSANEVANALAEAVSGSMEDFVALMNERAGELGCVNTNFANPSGLHDNLHYTCARDLATIFMACLSAPNFITIDSTVTYVIPETNLVDETRPMKTTHLMLRSDSEFYNPEVICGKTGHTDEAGACLITYASHGDLELVVVTMNGAKNAQYTDTQALLDYCFSTFTYGSSDIINAYLFDETDTNALAEFSAVSQSYLYKAENASFLVPYDLDACDIEVSYDESNTPSQVTLSYNGLNLATLPLVKNPELNATNPGLDIGDASVMHNVEHDYTPYYIAGIVIAAIVLAIVLLFLTSEHRRRTRHYHRRSSKKLR
ncbi:MAG: TIGR01906 family membrane protein [Lachnospiraceae bacterium]|nr:TIGR01906 family membrane protein [Lachnospiraceae bacterium]